MCSPQPLFDAAGQRRSPATMPGFRQSTAQQGQRYPADPPTVDEIIAVMRHARHEACGDRLNGLIVVLWRAGPRINEALALTETDLGSAPRVDSRVTREERSPSRGRDGRLGMVRLAAMAG